MKTLAGSRKASVLVLSVTLAAVLITAACSSNSAPAVSSSPSREATLKTVALHTSAPVASAPAVSVSEDASAPGHSSEFVSYRSRDYAVSFQYPWQYAFLSARTLANADASDRPQPDGFENQVVLAGVEIPRGYYPDTDFERGYFLLSLNQNLDEQQCQALLLPGKGESNKEVKDSSADSNVARLPTRTINGVQFHWNEVENGGQGSAMLRRNYTSFANGTCYELEMGVNTNNQDGLAREIDPDRVLYRLETILQSVKITPAMQDTPAGTATSSVSPVEIPQQ